MKHPAAFPMQPSDPSPAPIRPPRAFAAHEATADSQVVQSHSDATIDAAMSSPLPRLGWLSSLFWSAAGILFSLALGLALNSLIAGLFATAPWLGWVGLGILAVFVMAALALLVRELGALSRLRALDHLRSAASAAIASDRLRDAGSVVAELRGIYASRPDLARPLSVLGRGQPQLMDGADLVKFTERTLMAPLDHRAREMTAAAARRVALVTAISPRALVDIAYVAWESIRLGTAVARLYGARPGLWGTWRLLGAILGHLAVTGGLVLTDGLVEQLVGQGLAARLSQRLGEGVVNGLMTVRVGIAAVRVVRPLPFATEPAPVVRDYLPDLVNLVRGQGN